MSYFQRLTIPNKIHYLRLMEIGEGEQINRSNLIKAWKMKAWNDQRQSDFVKYKLPHEVTNRWAPLHWDTNLLPEDDDRYGRINITNLKRWAKY